MLTKFYLIRFSLCVCLISKLIFQFNVSRGASKARLGCTAGNCSVGAWSPSLLDLEQWLQVDLGKITVVTKIATQGGGEASQWVTEYQVSYSFDGDQFKFYQQASNKSLGKVKCESKARTTDIKYLILRSFLVYNLVLDSTELHLTTTCRRIVSR